AAAFHIGAVPMEKDYLILNRASASRTSGSSSSAGSCARLWAPRGSHTETRLRRYARGCYGGIRQELAAGVAGSSRVPSLEPNIFIAGSVRVALSAREGGFGSCGGVHETVLACCCCG